MARKKKYGVTSAPRFNLKIYRIFQAGVPEDLAKDAASAVTTAWEGGFSMYKEYREKAKAKLRELQVPGALIGLYLAFVNELIHKVIIRNIASADEIIEKWTRQGLDPGILRDLADYLGFPVEAGTPGTPPEPAPKG